MRQVLSRTNSHVALALTIGMVTTAVAGLASRGAEDVAFRYAIDNSPLDVTPKPGETLTEQAKEFRRTGQNPYNGQQDALDEGKKLYATYCQVCHLPDGSGRMGASLIGEKHVHERITNDVGLFEVIFGGAAGAMQPFGKRMTQDQILKVMAYLRTLMKS